MAENDVWPLLEPDAADENEGPPEAEGNGPNEAAAIPDVGGWGAGDGLQIPTVDEMAARERERGRFHPMLVNVIFFLEEVVSGQSWRHCEAVCVYMLLHGLTFISTLAIIFAIAKITSFVAGADGTILVSWFTLHVALLGLFLARVAANYIEYNYLLPHYLWEVRASTFWKHVPFASAVTLAAFAYLKLLSGFHHKLTVVTSGSVYHHGDTGHTVWFMLSAIYIFYVTTSIGLTDGRWTTILNQVIQSGFSMVLGAASSSLGGYCAELLQMDTDSYTPVVTSLLASILVLTSAFVLLHHQLLACTHASKIFEMVWGFMACYQFIAAFLVLDMEPADHLPEISDLFYSTLAFSLSNLAKLVMCHYWIEVEGPRPPPPLAF